ncbi:hypothetical protein AWZ03_015401 [Drosophila navojoa]|uniref:Uncharacterized protein n=1 Tax=Drosophila navojoa TaxID=7232 RepID=A0A484ALB2_DRONA|nr:hypothetical protein AWZ03_015401 [Drosophila navojoa]
MREQLARLVSLHKTSETFCNRPVKNCEVQTTSVKKVVEKASDRTIAGSNTPKRSREVSSEQRKTPSTTTAPATEAQCSEPNRANGSADYSPKSNPGRSTDKPEQLDRCQKTQAYAKTSQN